MGYIRPSQKWYCFFCGKRVDLGSCDIYHGKTGDLLRKASWWTRWRSHFFIETLDGEYYVQNFACRKCPNCPNFLPPNMETARNIVIAVLGDVTVGKTHYIAACINQMGPAGPMRYLQEVTGCQALNQDVEKRYLNELYNPLFQDKIPLSGTQPVALLKAEEKLSKPLIYKLTLRKSSALEKIYNLIFYDASGEDLREQETLVNHKSYALDPDAIIYIADPLTIQGIESRTPYRRTSDHAPDYVLRWAIDLIKPFKRLRGRPLTIPIAITLSKSDLLEYVQPDDAPFRLLDESDHRGGLNLEDIELVSQEVQRLLEKYGAYDLLSTQRLSENVCFFATSATGCPPNPDTGRFDSVTPRRCLDPLLWLLSRLGIF